MNLSRVVSLFVRIGLSLLLLLLFLVHPTIVFTNTNTNTNTNTGGTDVAIYLSKKDLPESIPIRVFD